MRSRLRYSQLETLVEFLEKNPEVAQGLARSVQEKLKTKKKWANITHKLNSIREVKKNSRGWAKYWAKKKFTLKKIYLGQTNGTDGRSLPSMSSLSSLDIRMIQVMGVTPTSIKVSSPRVKHEDLHSPSPEHIYTDPMCDEMITEDAVPDMDPTETKPTTTELPDRGPSESRTSPHMSSSSLKNTDSLIERFAQLEEQRINAERLTAQTLANMTVAINNVADSLREGLNAIANALTDRKNL